MYKPGQLNRHSAKKAIFGTGPSFMAPYCMHRTALTEAGNFVLMASTFHALAANFSFCACVLHVTRISMLTRLAQKFSTFAFKWGIIILSAEIGGKQSHENGH